MGENQQVPGTKYLVVRTDDEYPKLGDRNMLYSDDGRDRYFSTGRKENKKWKMEIKKKKKTGPVLICFYAIEIDIRPRRRFSRKARRKI